MGKDKTNESLRVASVNDVDSTHEKQHQHKLQDDNARLANPLLAFTRAEIANRARAWADAAGLAEDRELFAKGALVAQNPERFEEMQELSADDIAALQFERSHPYRQPKELWLLVLSVSLSACVQGMDQSVINGALLFFPAQFGIENRADGWITGIVSAAPYFSCALLACWTTAPLNYYFGRRGTIAITCVIASATCFWAAFTNTWWHLMISRIVLGFGISPKSATTPIYAAETAPAKIRGALAMQWQVWTAFGIMLGYVASIAFYSVPDRSGIVGLNWRLMLGSAAVPPLVVLSLIFFSPESPRWLMGKGRNNEAFAAMCRLRNTKLQAARDLYLAYELLEAEKEVIQTRRNPIIELFSVPRNRLAAQSAFFVMLMQQACGVNVIAYYSSQIFVDAGATQVGALGASLGWGTLNWLAAAPALFTIDRLGRRALLLIGYPAMSLSLFISAFSFLAPAGTGRIAGVALGVYLHCLFYSPTAGPVPFTYSAEAFPLYIRELGMSLAVATTWFFNGVLSLTWPAMQRNLTSTGAFAFYAACNLVGLVFAWFLLPETKSLTLEQLDSVFSVPNHDHAVYQTRMIPYWFGRALGRQPARPEPLYAHERMTEEERKNAGGTLMPAGMGH